MAKELFEGTLTKSMDWGDADGNGHPASGRVVQDFIKNELANRFGCLYYDQDSRKYHLFADTEDRDTWIKGGVVAFHESFDAPARATINFVDGTSSPLKQTVILGQSGNEIHFNYLIRDNNQLLKQEYVEMKVMFNKDGEISSFSQRIDISDDALDATKGTAVKFNIDNYLTKAGTYEITVSLTGMTSGASLSMMYVYTVVNLQLALGDFEYKSKPIENNLTSFSLPFTVTGATGEKYVEVYVDGIELFQNVAGESTNDVYALNSQEGLGTAERVSTSFMFYLKNSIYPETAEDAVWPLVGDNYGGYELVNNGTELVEVPKTFTDESKAGKKIFAPGKHSIQLRVYILKDALSTDVSNRIYSVTKYLDIVVKDVKSSEDKVYVIYNSDLPAGEIKTTVEDITTVEKTVTQYDYLKFAITVINTNENANTDINFVKVNEDNVESLPTFTATPSDKDYEFEYRMTESGNFVIKAQYKNEDKFIVNTTVEEFQTGGQTLKEERRNLVVKYSAENRNNKMQNKEVWTNSADTGRINPLPVDLSKVPFNERCGWISNALVLRDGVTVSFPFNIFDYFATDAGLTFEIEFETEGVQDDNAQILNFKSVNDNNKSFINITATSASVYTPTISTPGTIPLETNFKDGTRNKIAFVFNPIGILGQRTSDMSPDETPNSSRYYGHLENPNLIFIYVNGVLDRATRWGDGRNINSDTVKWTNVSGEDAQFTIGDPEGKAVVKLYNIRVYNTALSPDTEFKNFMVDSPNLVDIFTRNNVLDSSNQISFATLKNMIPTLLLSIDYHGINGESNKKANHQYDMQYFDPDPDFKHLGFYVRNGWMSCQGTSSMNYPTKNLRPYFNKITNSAEAPSRSLMSVMEDNTSALERGISTTPVFATEYWPYSLYGAENEDNVADFIDGNLRIENGSVTLGDVVLPYSMNAKENKDSVKAKITTIKDGVEKTTEYETRYFHLVGANRLRSTANALAEKYAQAGEMLFKKVEVKAGKYTWEPVEFDSSKDMDYYIDSYRPLWDGKMTNDEFVAYLKQLRWSGVKIFSRKKYVKDDVDYGYVYEKVKKLDLKNAEVYKGYYGLGPYWRQYDGNKGTNNSGWTDRWTLKADFAESSMCHNAGVARLWGNAMKNVILSDGSRSGYLCRTTAQKEVGDDINHFDVRTSCDGKPVVLFVKQSHGFSLTTGRMGYDDASFAGLFNIMTDKGSTKLFGFEDIKNENNKLAFTAYAKGVEIDKFGDPADSEVQTRYNEQKNNRVQCYEFLQNGSLIATGLSLVFDKKDSTGNALGSSEIDFVPSKDGEEWTLGKGRPIFTDFESRYPDDGQIRHEGDDNFPENEQGVETTDLEAFWRWLNFCKPAVKYVVDGKMDGYTMSSYRPITWDEAKAEFAAGKDIYLRYIASGNEYYAKNGDEWRNPNTGVKEILSLDMASLEADPGWPNYYVLNTDIHYDRVTKTIDTRPINDSSWETELGHIQEHIWRGKTKSFDSKYRANQEDEDEVAEFGVQSYLWRENGQFMYVNHYGETVQYLPDSVGTQVNEDEYDTYEGKDMAEWTYMKYFQTTKWDHLDVYKVAAYYIYITRFGAVDQSIKNCMMTTEDGEHFYFINYDNDTVLGVRNDAVLIYNWDMDRNTFDETLPGYAYAGAKSVLWNNLEADDEFMTLVKMIDKQMFDQGLLSVETVLGYLNEKQEGVWCERLYNAQEDIKYLSTFKQDFSQTRYLNFLQGNRESHRTWWVSNRWNLYDSIWNSGLYDLQHIDFYQSLSTASPTNPVTFARITATGKYRFKVLQNQTIFCDENLVAGENLELITRANPAIGDPMKLFGPHKIKVINFRTNTQSLTKLIMAPGMAYTNSKGVAVNTEWVTESGVTLEKLLIGDGRNNAAIAELTGLDKIVSVEELDFRNCKELGNLSLTNLPNLHRYRASGSTKATRFQPKDSVSLYEVSLSDTLNILSLDKVEFKYQPVDDYVIYQTDDEGNLMSNSDALPYTEDADGRLTSYYTEEADRKYTLSVDGNEYHKAIFSYKPTASLAEVSLKGVTGFDTYQFIKDWKDAIVAKFGAARLNAVTLVATGLNWSGITFEQFCEIYDSFNVTPATFNGIFNLVSSNGSDSITVDEYNAILTKFGAEVFNADNSIVFTSGENVFMTPSDITKYIPVENDGTIQIIPEGTKYYNVAAGEEFEIKATLFPLSDDNKIVYTLWKINNNSQANQQARTGEYPEYVYTDNSTNGSSRLYNRNGYGVFKADEKTRDGKVVYVVRINRYNEETGQVENYIQGSNIYINVVNKNVPVKSSFRLVENDGTAQEIGGEILFNKDAETNHFKLYYDSSVYNTGIVESSIRNMGDLNTAGLTVSNYVTAENSIEFDVTNKILQTTQTGSILIDVELDTNVASKKNISIELPFANESTKITKVVISGEGVVATTTKYTLTLGNTGETSYDIELISSTGNTPNIPLKDPQIEYNFEIGMIENTTISIDKENSKLVININDTVKEQSVFNETQFTLTYEDIYGNVVSSLPMNLTLNIEYPKSIVLEMQNYEDDYNFIETNGKIVLSNKQGTAASTEVTDVNNQIGTDGYLWFRVVAKGRNVNGEYYEITEPTTINVTGITAVNNDIDPVISWTFDTYSYGVVTGNNNRIGVRIPATEQVYTTKLTITGNYVYDILKDGVADEPIAFTKEIEIVRTLASATHYNNLRSNAVYLVDTDNAFYLAKDNLNTYTETDIPFDGTVINNALRAGVKFVGIGLVYDSGATKTPYFMSMLHEYDAYRLYGMTRTQNIDGTYNYTNPYPATSFALRPRNVNLSGYDYHKMAMEDETIDWALRGYNDTIWNIGWKLLGEPGKTYVASYKDMQTILPYHKLFDQIMSNLVTLDDSPYEVDEIKLLNVNSRAVEYNGVKQPRFMTSTFSSVDNVAIWCAPKLDTETNELVFDSASLYEVQFINTFLNNAYIRIFITVE